MKKEIKEKILELKAAGRNHSIIASMLGIHKHIVDEVINIPAPKPTPTATPIPTPTPKTNNDD